jgi:hypothetical protein
MGHDKSIGLVAHDNKKRDLVEWAKFNRDLLAHHRIYATGTTGQMLEAELGFEVVKLQSGPLGGDQQVGAKIADGEIDFLIFFWDPHRTDAARSGCEGPAQDGRGVEHTDRLQSSVRRLHDLIAPDGRGVLPSRARL